MATAVLLLPPAAPGRQDTERQQVPGGLCGMDGYEKTWAVSGWRGALCTADASIGTGYEGKCW